MKKILSVVLCLSIFLTATGCSSKKATPSETVTNAVQALSSVNRTDAKNYIAFEDLMNYGILKQEAFQTDECLKYFFGKLKLEIVSEKIDGDKATVKARITNIDLKDVLSQSMLKVVKVVFADTFSGSSTKMTDDEVTKITQKTIIETLKSDNLKTVTNEVDVNLVMDKGKWKIKMDDKLQNALLGGFVDAMNDMKGDIKDSLGQLLK